MLRGVPGVQRFKRVRAVEVLASRIRGRGVGAAIDGHRHVDGAGVVHGTVREGGAIDGAGVVHGAIREGGIGDDGIGLRVHTAVGQGVNGELRGGGIVVPDEGQGAVSKRPFVVGGDGVGGGVRVMLAGSRVFQDHPAGDGMCFALQVSGGQGVGRRGIGILRIRLRAPPVVVLQTQLVLFQEEIGVLIEGQHGAHGVLALSVVGNKVFRLLIGENIDVIFRARHCASVRKRGFAVQVATILRGRNIGVAKGDERRYGEVSARPIVHVRISREKTIPCIGGRFAVQRRYGQRAADSQFVSLGLAEGGAAVLDGQHRDWHTDEARALHGKVKRREIVNDGAVPHPGLALALVAGGKRIQQGNQVFPLCVLNLLLGTVDREVKRDLAAVCKGAAASQNDAGAADDALIL